MVVGAPDVGEVVEAAAEFLGHVADVGGEIGRLAVGADDDPVLVVAEVGGAEPDRTVLLIDVAALTKPLDRPIHPAFRMEARLTGPDIEPDAQGRQAALDSLAYAAGRPMTDDAIRVGVEAGVGVRLGRTRPDVLRKLGHEIRDVIALVAILGHGHTAPQGRDGRAKVADLPTGIVEVVLAGDLLPARLQDSTEQVADECAPRVADVQRAGRVGRHELDIDRARPDRRHLAPGPWRGEDPGDRRLQRVIGQAQVEEPRGGRFRRGDRRRGGAVRDLSLELRDEHRGDGEGGHPARPGQLHRQVAGEIPTERIRRPLDLHVGS